MKRLIVRFTLLSMVVGLGTVVVYEAQRRLHPPESPPAELAAAPNLDPQPIPLAEADPAQMATPLSSQALPDGEMILAGGAGQDPTDFQPFANPPSGAPADQPGGPLTGDPYAAPDQFAAQPQDAYAPPGALPADADSGAGDMIAEGAPQAGGAFLPHATRPIADEQPLADPAGADAGNDGWQDNFSPPSSNARGGYRARPAAPDRMPPASPEGLSHGVGRPGERQLEGTQAPSLTIEKRAPNEIQVGKAATFSTTVRNAGQVAAQGVEVRDMVPQGTELVGSSPQAEVGPQGELVWKLGTLKPGAEVTVQMQLMPLTEGEIGSVATLHFEANASARTKATRPQVAVEVTAPQRVMAGTDVVLKIKVSNPGSGAATGVVVTEMVPPELAHAEGRELELDIGTLKPGDSRLIELPLKAVHAGMVDNMLAARAEGNVRAEGHAQFEVIAPDLKVGMTGPKKRFLERTAVYNIAITNPGTAPAKDIELAVALPKGLKFVEANNAGQYDPASGNVYWSLEQLSPGESGVVTLATMPIESGEHRMQISAKGKGNLSAQLDETISVEGIAAVVFELIDVSDPIEVGGETAYEIRVTNQGSKASNNVRLVALLPSELEAIDADGPTGHAIDGQRVLFEPITQLAPKADTTFTVKVKAATAGDVRLRVQLVTDEMRSPVTKEESTHVYTDE